MAEPKDFWALKFDKFRREKNFEESMKCKEKIKEIDDSKNSANFWLKKGCFYLEIFELEQALKCFNKDLEQNQVKFETLYQKGIALYLMKKYFDAVECFNKAWEINYSEFFNTRGQIQKLREHKEFEKIVGHSTKLKENQNLPYQFWHYKALSLIGINKFSEAMECLDNALKIRSNDPVILFDKAKCEILRGNEENCLNQLKKAYEFDKSIKEKALGDSIFSSLNNKIQIF